MADVPEVRYRLSAEGVDEVVRALEKVKAAGKGAAGSGKGFGLLNDALGDLKGLLPALGIAGAVVGLTSMTKSAIDTADAMQKLSKRTGISVESLSVLANAAALADVETEDLAKSLKKMAVSLVELETGGGAAAEGFRKIGLTSKDLVGLKPDQAFVKISSALVKLPSAILQADAAVKIFGKSADKMIPLMQDLADGGFDRLKKRMEEMGLVMSSGVAAQAEVLNDEMKLLEKSVKASALAFASGMLPSLLNVTRTLQGVSKESRGFWQELGLLVGKSVDYFVMGTSAVGAWAGALSTIQWSKILTDFRGFRDELSNAKNAVKQTLFGELNKQIDEVPARVAKMNEALAKLGDGSEKAGLSKKIADALSKQDPREMLAGIDVVEKEIQSVIKAQDQAAAEAAVLARERAIKLSKELSNLAQGQAQNDLQERQATLKAQAEAEKQLYEDQLIDLAEYYRLRRATIDQGFDAEIATLNKKRAKIKSEALDPNDENAALKRKASVDAITSQIAVKQKEQDTAREASFHEEKKAVEDLGKRKLEIEAQVMDAQGKTHEAELLRIKIQADELKKALGKGSDENVSKLTEALTRKEDFARLQNVVGQSQSQLGIVDTNLQNQVASGEIFPFEAAQKYKEAVDALVPSLITQLQARRDLTETTDAEKIQLDQQIVSLQQTQIAANNAAQGYGSLKASMEQALTSDVTNFLTKGIDEAENFGDAMRGLALSVVDSLRQIAAQMLATLATQQLLKAAGGMFGFSGGGLVAAATGGYISGPGTGTSDSIAARLSDGEFVVRSAVVKQPGILPHLIALNQGAGRPSLKSRGGVPHFAEGGLVTAPEAMSQGLSVHADFGLEEGVIAKRVGAFMKSPDGQRIQIENLGSNQKRASRALGRG